MANIFQISNTEILYIKKYVTLTVNYNSKESNNINNSNHNHLWVLLFCEMRLKMVLGMISELITVYIKFCSSNQLSWMEL